MRINLFIARATGMSRRSADKAVLQGQVKVNGEAPPAGYAVRAGDLVELDGHRLLLPDQTTTIMLNKPPGYVCSRNGQGSRTVYELLPAELHGLKPVGRLDKNSSGLLLLTDDGQLANRLTHPRYVKEKVYEVSLDKPLGSDNSRRIAEGVKLDDGTSRLKLAKLGPDGKRWRITMHEGRNRQIRRTFAALGYEVLELNRTKFGPYSLDTCPRGKHRIIYTDD